MKKHNRKAAFSLPELLIFLAIVGVITVMMLTIIKPSEKALKYQYYNAYNTLNTAAYNIRQDVIDVNNALLENSGLSYAEEDKKFPDTAKTFCAKFAVNPDTPNDEYGYINTTEYKCNNFSSLSSFSEGSFTDSAMAFRASNSMKYYISGPKTSSFKDDLDGGNVSIKYFIVWVDLNGDRRPNTPKWTKNRPADIVPFVVTDTGKVFPVGQPAVDRRYMQAYVDIDSTESSEYTASTTFYQAQQEAFGGKQYPTVDLSSILWDSNLSELAKIQDKKSISNHDQREICKATEQEKEEGDFIPPCTVIVEEQDGGL